jgi:archaeosine synthase beta-subunit
MTAYSDEWVIAQRGPRNPVDPKRPYHFLLEHERSESGEVVPIVTIFLTNRECPWRCVMCDLWKSTLTHGVSPGDIPRQIEFALGEVGRGVLAEPPRQIKLYNSGSFFDAAAIPPADYPAIASLLSNFNRVIVECHPALIGPRALPFQKMIQGKLEIAMGLETVHPEVLPRLNKRMTLGMFSEAAAFLHQHEIDLRTFVLLKPPFLDDQEALLWMQRSIEFAFDCHATAVSIIPVRAGNGALEALNFSLPRLDSLEAALAAGIGLRRGRVFADVWDLQQFSHCDACFDARRERLGRMNLSQEIELPIQCGVCRRTST